jgi:hypothetical protein
MGIAYLLDSSPGFFVALMLWQQPKKITCTATKVSMLLKRTQYEVYNYSYKLSPNQDLQILNVRNKREQAFFTYIHIHEPIQ